MKVNTMASAAVIAVSMGFLHVGVACTTGGGGGNGNGGGGGDLIFPGDYATTYREVRPCRPTIEHINAGSPPGVTLASTIRVLVNPEAEQAYLADETLPEGAVVIKEEFSGFDCEAETLVTWSVMRKEAAGFDPDGDGDFSWQRVKADGEVVFNDKVTCISCHAEPECLSRDYMCTLCPCPGDS